MPAIYLGKNPERDRNIDDICQMIRNCARAGIPQVKYASLIGIPRSGAPRRARPVALRRSSSMPAPNRIR
jgi:mannonate dehydratase